MGRKDDTLHNYFSKNNNKNIILIGPEGGFSSDEEELIKSYEHVVSLKLFDRILRAITAAVMALSIIV